MTVIMNPTEFLCWTIKHPDKCASVNVLKNPLRYEVQVHDSDRTLLPSRLLDADGELNLGIKKVDKPF